MTTFVDTMKQLGPSRLGIMGAIMVGLLLFFIFISLRVSTPDMQLLYSDLNTIDSSAMAAKLQEANIPFDVSQDGTRILVSEKDKGRARLLLADAGLPNGGSMGYEIFDKDSGFGTTNFVQNINQVRALEGELARTISAVQGVRSARVHLVLPQRELFSHEAQKSSASVFISMRGSTKLEQGQIASIQALVSSAVPGLKSSSVSVIDSNGTLLARGDGNQDDVSQMTAKTEDMRRKYEDTMSSKIEDQVSRIVGYGNVRATVTAEMNFDRISTNEELYDPEKQVVRSSQVTNEKSSERNSSSGQDVSVENNLPGSGSLLGGNEPTSQNDKTEEVTNYEISKTVRSTVSEVGEIKKLSVAVLVDGKYAPAPEAPADDKTKKDGKSAKPVMTYTPRTQDEMDRITALVKSAVGYDESRGDKIEVVNLQFAPVDAEQGDFTDTSQLFGFDKNKLLDVAEIITVAVMIILVVMLVLQPMVNRLIAASPSAPDEDIEADLLGMRPMNPALTGPSDADMMASDAQQQESLINMQGVEGKVKASSVKKVEEIVQNYPNETVSVIRSWMTQETT